MQTKRKKITALQRAKRNRKNPKAALAKEKDLLGATHQFLNPPTESLAVAIARELEKGSHPKGPPLLCLPQQSRSESELKHTHEALARAFPDLSAFDGSMKPETISARIRFLALATIARKVKRSGLAKPSNDDIRNAAYDMVCPPYFLIYEKEDLEAFKIVFRNVARPKPRTDKEIWKRVCEGAPKQKKVLGVVRDVLGWFLDKERFGPKYDPKKPFLSPSPELFQKKVVDSPESYISTQGVFHPPKEKG